jgi:hypothetical protein
VLHPNMTDRYLGSDAAGPGLGHDESRVAAAEAHGLIDAAVLTRQEDGAAGSLATMLEAAHAQITGAWPVPLERWEDEGSARR